MKCFSCGCDVIDTGLGVCANCSAILNATKSNFISYIGSPDSLAGYQKSYKLLLLKYIIEAIIDESEATVTRVIPAIKQYYLDRKNKGLQPDYDVDTRISEIENSSEYDVFAVIKSQPFKVINEKGYLFLNHNSNDKLVFVFNENISDAMSCDEWRKLLDIVNAKLELYFNRYDSLNNVSITIGETPCTKAEEIAEEESKENLDLSLSVLEITNLSVRAKNILMRNKLYTIGAVMKFIEYNDLRYLENMGQKTYEEIMTLIQSSDFRVSASSNPNSIASLFAGNTYHLFVEFCERNGMTTLSDLNGFDFALLLNEPGFGVGKLNAIKEKYNNLLHDGTSFHNHDEQDETSAEAQPAIIIDQSNADLGISYLSFARITAR